MATGNVVAGYPIIAADVQDELDALPQGVIARGSRATSSTAASAAQGVLRVDSVPLLAGRRYHIRTNALTATSSVAADRVQVALRMSTVGTATTASTVFSQSNSPAIDSTGAGWGTSVDYNYTPAVNETASIILNTQRLSGTGNAQLLVTASVTIDIEVIDCGVDPGNTGVDL